MNFAYSIIQWLLTLFFGPLLAGLIYLFQGGNIHSSISVWPIYFIILIASTFLSIPALMLHLLFNWLFFIYRIRVWFVKSALILLTLMLSLVTLVGFNDMDLDSPLVIGYCLAAVLSGIVLPVAENETTGGN
jgi:hypothetical protein